MYKVCTFQVSSSVERFHEPRLPPDRLFQSASPGGVLILTDHLVEFLLGPKQKNFDLSSKQLRYWTNLGTRYYLVGNN